jgi:hypothetical protein
VARKTATTASCDHHRPRRILGFWIVEWSYRSSFLEDGTFLATAAAITVSLLAWSLLRGTAVPLVVVVVVVVVVVEEGGGVGGGAVCVKDGFVNALSKSSVSTIVGTTTTGVDGWWGNSLLDDMMDMAMLVRLVASIQRLISKFQITQPRLFDHT